MSKINLMILKVLKDLKEEKGASKEFQLYNKAILKETNGFSIEFLESIKVSDLMLIDLNLLTSEISMNVNEKDFLLDIIKKIDTIPSIVGEEVFF